MCDDEFTNTAAKVVCKQLGMSGGRVLKDKGLKKATGGKIWLDNVKCNGSEYRLWKCPRNSLGSTDCNHEEDIGVQCGMFVYLFILNY